MALRSIFLRATALAAASATLTGAGTSPGPFFGPICSVADTGTYAADDAAPKNIPVANCPAPPTGYTSLPSIGGRSQTRADLTIGYDPDTKNLCYVATGLPLAPVLRVGVGHTLSIRIANTLRDSFIPHRGNINCAIDSFGGEGLCLPKPIFLGVPGDDGTFYPLLANEAHTADGTTNLHVHGLFVSPLPCSDETLQAAAYPTNWHGRRAPLAPCQADPSTYEYTYQIPQDHPAGLYWYHTHRHGQAEHQTQMGLAGAIVIEDKGDAWRESIGVTDEVLLVTDTPNTACLVGPNCDAKIHPGVVRRQDNAAAARAYAANHATITQAADPGERKLDPRIDQVDQAGSCAYGSSGPDGGVELWTLLLNGAPVPEASQGFPPDNELLAKTMQPNQRQIFRLVNGASNSYLVPQLVLSQNGTETILPLEVFARDGVGIADAEGNRRIDRVNVAKRPIILPPSGRIEFVVHAPPAGATLYVQSAQFAPGCAGNAYPARRLLRITAAGTPVDPGEPNDHDLLRHTPSLAPYLATLGDTASVHRTFALSEYSRQFTYGVTHWLNGPPTAADYDPAQTDFFITETAADDGSVRHARTQVRPFNGHNDAPQVTVHLHGQPSVTEDWLIENSTLEAHAFHIHQVHFRDITKPGLPVQNQPILDVINVPPAQLIGDIATGYPGAPGWVHLRLTFTTQDIGEFVYHCHILEHEDNGMMGKIAVVAD